MKASESFAFQSKICELQEDIKAIKANCEVEVKNAQESLHRELENVRKIVSDFENRELNDLKRKFEFKSKELVSAREENNKLQSHFVEF